MLQKSQEEYKNYEYNKKYYIKPNDKIEDILAMFNLSPLEFLKLNEYKIIKVGEEIIISK